MAEAVDKEIIKQVSRIEFSVRKILSGLIVGTNTTSLRGQGMTFSDLRPYSPGDDIRNFAWNIMARTGEPFVKQFEEERDLEIHVALDVGPNMLFGGEKLSKFIIEAYVLALIGLSAAKLGDKFGVLLFAENQKKLIPVFKGEDHLRRSLLEFLSLEGQSLFPSNPNLGLEYFMRVRAKRSLCFLLSDFQRPLDKKLLSMVKQKHNLSLIHIFDPYERSFPQLGWMPFVSYENDHKALINTSWGMKKLDLAAAFDKKVKTLSDLAKRFGLGYINQSTHDDSLFELVKGLKLKGIRGA